MEAAVWLTPLFAAGVMLPVLQIIAAVRAQEFSRPWLRVMTAGLYMVQPAARLWGRLTHGLTPWRKADTEGGGCVPRTQITWSENWRAAHDWLEMVRANFRRMGVVAETGGSYDRWDFQIRGGLFAGARLRLAVEEHGSGKQLLRWRIWPHAQGLYWMTAAVLSALSIGAGVDEAWMAAGVIGACVVLVSLRAAVECGRGIGWARHALEELR